MRLAMRGRHFCYYHLRSRAKKRAIIADLQSQRAVNLAITKVLRGIIAKEIDIKEGGVILFGLQTAIKNIAATSASQNSK